MTEPARYDQSWKEALDLYFEPILAFFFPAEHALIDWSRPLEFLDKELQQLIPASEVGKRTADKLVKAWRKDGEPTLILLHLEVQSQQEERMEERVYVYNYRIFDRYRLPVISLVILGDEQADWRPFQYEYRFAGSVMLLQFPTVKLLDYQDRWAELEASDNPAALMVMAHLKTKATTGDPVSRKLWKWNLTRRLFERGYSREEVVKLFRLIDWMMTLPDGLEREFKQELDNYQEELKMPLLTSIERIAKEEGKEEGREEGREEGIQIGEQRTEQRIEQIARKMLAAGTDPSQVASFTGLTPERIQHLISQSES